MSVKRTVRTITNSCCNSVSYLFETELPILKSQLSFFKDSGYMAPHHFTTSGIFYVQKQALIATGAFGTTRISVRCSGPTCASKLDEFEKILENAVNGAISD